MDRRVKPGDDAAAAGEAAQHTSLDITDAAGGAHFGDPRGDRNRPPATLAPTRKDKIPWPTL
jgi:hypothetical protein